MLTLHQVTEAQESFHVNSPKKSAISHPTISDLAENWYTDKLWAKNKIFFVFSEVCQTGQKLWSGQISGQGQTPVLIKRSYLENYTT